ncbi:glycosyltransferase family protein [Candidatus Curtissbacteria bacterium]|nr:glycosyltransferase family protein [Candidatus Curtissbacteria bacterium]
MNIHAIIQARMGSTRLPGKVMMKLFGKPILAWVIEEAARAKLIDKVIVATTDSEPDLQIAEFCQRKNIDFFRGSENDVLARYVDTAKKFSSEIVVRITSDNPFGQSFIFDELIKKHIREKNDYTYSRGYPLGSACEVFTTEALALAAKKSTTDYHREHIGTYFIDNPTDFAIGCLEASEKYSFPQVRVTVDTQEDFKTAENVVKKLGDNVSLDRVIQLFKDDNSVFVNRSVTQFYPNERIKMAYSVKIPSSK